MSLIKLASTPIMVINHNADPNAGSSKNFTGRNVAAAAAGTVGAFAGNEIAQHPRFFPKFNKELMKHRFGQKMATGIGGFIGAGALFAATKKKQQPDQDPQIFMM